MKKQHTSIFLDHYNTLMTSKDSTEFKNQLTGIVNESKINQMDKRKILMDVTPLDTLKSLQFYLTNSMLKYSGLGVR